MKMKMKLPDITTDFYVISRSLTSGKEGVRARAFKSSKLLRLVMLEQSRFQESIHSNNCVSDAIEHVWCSVSSGITEKWLRTLELPIAIDMTMLKMRKIVGWSVISHDGSLTEDVLEMLISEDEPIPVSIDPWARGTGAQFTNILSNAHGLILQLPHSPHQERSYCK